MADRWLVSGEYERGGEELAIDIHIDKEKITWYRLDDSRRDV
jgi:hypothetical protein